MSNLANLIQGGIKCIYLSKVFETEVHSATLKEKEDLISELYRQIGELKVDNDWLKKASMIPLEERPRHERAGLFFCECNVDVSGTEFAKK